MCIICYPCAVCISSSGQNSRIRVLVTVVSETLLLLHQRCLVSWCNEREQFYISDLETAVGRVFWSFPEDALQRTEGISWADHVRSEEVLRRVKEETNIPHKFDKRKDYLIVHILHRDRLLKQVKDKGKVIPLQARCGPEGGQRYSSTLP